MTKLLEKASKLPNEARDSLAKFLLEELESERRWDELFAKSPDILSELAR